MSTKKPLVDVKNLAGGAALTAAFGVIGMAYKEIAPANWINATQFSVLLIFVVSVMLSTLSAKSEPGDGWAKRISIFALHVMLIFATLYAGSATSVEQKPEDALGASQLISPEGNLP